MFKFKRFEVLTGEDIFWRVEPDDPLWLPLAPVLPAKLLNPVATVHVADKLGHQFNGPLILGSGGTVLSTQGVVLEWDGVLGEQEFSALVHGLPKVFACLRHVSGQYRLSAVLQIAAVFGLPDGEVVRRWPTTVELQCFIREDLVTRTIPFADVPRAAAMADGGGPPVFGTFFLDALKAQAAGDWRMGLLLAALSVETGVAQALAEWHEGRLATVPRPPTVVELPVAGGGRAVKDPVYDALSEKSGFKYLLHERPLHLGQLSLLVEDEETYRRMLRLYAARNKIAHLGGPGVGAQNCYQLTQVDVDEAVNAATRCLAFFGKDVPTPIGRGGMVEARSGTFGEEVLGRRRHR